MHFGESINTVSDVSSFISSLAIDLFQVKETKKQSVSLRREQCKKTTSETKEKKREGPAYPERTLDKLHLEASTKFCLSRSQFFFLLLLLLSFNSRSCYFIGINNLRMVSVCWYML